MSVATTEAILLGCSDMMDRDTSAATIALHANRSLAAAFASVVLTLCHGRSEVALDLLDGALADLKEQIIERIHAATLEGIASSPIVRHPAAGSA